MADDRDPEPVGWNAIDGALAPIYGTSEPPFHFGTVLNAMLGGEDYLQGISVYRCNEPIPHWHYVTYGFTELYEKETDDKEVSGYGFELTFRLALNEKEPPSWPLSVLQNLGRYVFRSGNVFQPGHYLDCQGKIAIEEETDLRALLFMKDPALGSTKSPNGEFEFLQMMGITLDELALCRRWNAAGFLKSIAEKMPFFVTDLKRTSALLDPVLRAEMERTAAQEGSSSGSVFVGEAHYSISGKNAHVVLGANAVRELKELMVPRLGFARPLTVVSSLGRVRFVPGDEVGWKEIAAMELEITVPAAHATVVSSAIVVKAGVYSLPGCPSLVFEVRRSEIKDGQGNTIEVIG